MVIWKQSQVRKSWCNVTLKYENLVYCNLDAILHIFFLSNNIQITAWSYDRIEVWAGNEIMLEQSLKSYNSIKIWCNVTSKQYTLHQLIV